jgi:hypothetical protein
MIDDVSIDVVMVAIDHRFNRVFIDVSMEPSMIRSSIIAG